MNRRTFLLSVGNGAACLGLSPLAGCRSKILRGFDPGPYSVGARSMVFDDQGGGYVLDKDQHRILAVDAFHLVVGEFGGLGEEHGQLNSPVAADYGPEGRLYVLDSGNGRVQVFARGGEHVATIVETGELHMPSGLCIDGDRLYVSDGLNHRIQVYDLDGRHVESFGEDELNGPRGCAIAAGGELHVVDGGDASVVVFDASGGLVRRYGEYGTGLGQMLSPRSIVLPEDGRALVADPASSLVHVFDQSGDALGRFQPVDAEGVAVAPFGLALRPDGGLYIWTDARPAHLTEAG